ncbi:MAG: hypothetical protein GBAus27B_000563 [Mycoplasmataceae bacterium]|nr:MAG: hypothetical protein GBAus27B_000563 [Mycoplasmataceae bacterium]
MIKNKASINYSTFLSWLRDGIEIESAEFPDLSDEEFEFLLEQYQEWIKNFVWCDGCGKRINEEKAIFSHSHGNVEFCSQSCHKKWSNVDYLDFVTKSLKWEKKFKFWQKQGFEIRQIRKYLQQGFKDGDFMFLNWLKDEKHLVIEKINLESINISQTLNQFKYWFFMRSIPKNLRRMWN